MRTIPELKEGTHRAKATGTLPNGKPVVVNSDGTVSVAGAASVAQDIGSAVVFSPADDTNNTCVVYDSAANKIKAKPQSELCQAQVSRLVRQQYGMTLVQTLLIWFMTPMLRK